jgi:hypothetical protein
VNVDADAVGFEQVTRDLRDMTDRAENLNPVWRKVAVLWEDRQKAVFDGKLPALSPASVKRKRVNKRIPMVDTGDLRTATYRYSPIKADRDSASFGIPKGGKRKAIGAMHASRSGSRPKRDVVPRLRKAEKVEILDILADYVMDRP